MVNFLKDTFTVLWVDLRFLRRHVVSTVATSLVNPILYLLAFGYGLGRGISFEGVDYIAFVIPGIIALTSMSVSFGGAAMKLNVDRLYYKSFDEMLMSPISLTSIVVGKALIGVVRGLLSCFALLAMGLLLSSQLIVSPLFILVLIASCTTFSFMGVLAALMIRSHADMATFSNLVILPMSFLCGTFFSLSQVPDALRTVLNVLPLTHASQCLRAAALGQFFPWLSFVVLVGFGAAFFIGSLRVLKRTST